MRIPRLSFIVLLIVGIATIRAEGPAKESSDEVASWPRLATFSILGYDPDTGEVGGAVRWRVLCRQRRDSRRSWRRCGGHAGIGRYRLRSPALASISKRECRRQTS